MATINKPFNEAAAKANEDLSAFSKDIGQTLTDFQHMRVGNYDAPATIEFKLPYPVSDIAALPAYQELHRVCADFNACVTRGGVYKDGGLFKKGTFVEYAVTIDVTRSYKNSDDYSAIKKIAKQSPKP